MKKFRPGVSFGDFVIQDFKRARSKVREEMPREWRRGWLVMLGIAVMFGILAVRLVELQLFAGGKYGILAEENRIKRIKIAAQRGTIYDRHGAKLAENKEDSRYSQGDKLWVEGWTRVYPLGEIMAHAVGYLGEVGEEEVGLIKTAGQKYEPGDWMGRMGIEEKYEDVLRGVDGGRLVEVDNLGRVVRELGKQQPKPGKDLQTTLDGGVQEAAWRAMTELPVPGLRPGYGGPLRGAAIVARPATGEVLALVSVPAFDPNLFTQPGKSQAETAGAVDRVLGDRSLPLFNRSVGGVYPPGSTFKMVTTAAALESGKMEADFTYEDRGVVTVGGTTFSNWLWTKRGLTEGRVGFARAITRSTDTFFYKAGELTGPEEMARWAVRMGLGELTGVDIPGEAEGLIGTPQWKERELGERWFLGNTYHMAIGQGNLLVTPLQLNLMTNVLAAGGKKCRPHVAGEGMQCSDTGISASVLEIIKAGMVGACSAGGTAYPLFDWNEGALKGGSSNFAKATPDSSLPLIACKTGTAEYVDQDGKMRTHGWLTAFAPADDPQVSVTVVVEGGGEGSDVAAPVVRKILAKYFEVEDSYPYHLIRRGEGE